MCLTRVEDPYNPQNIKTMLHPKPITKNLIQPFTVLHGTWKN